MNPQSRLEKERIEGKRKRKYSIIEAAERVFREKGFERATMQEVADEENIGVATVFRYFPKKDQLIVAVAVNILENYLTYFKSVATMEVTCLQKVEKILDYFIADIDVENLDKTQLLEAFDSYATRSPEDIEGFFEYNRIRREISETLSLIMDEGINDGSIRLDIQAKDVIASIINAFGLFSRKLSLFKKIPSLEHDITSEEQLEIVKGIFMAYITR